MKLNIEHFKLYLKVNWKLSRNEALHKDNFVITLSNNGLEGRGEVAPNIRYGETPESILNDFNGLPSFSSPEEMIKYCLDSNLAHSLKCGLNCAATELIAKKSSKSIEEVLGISVSESPLLTSISVPIMESSLLDGYLSGLKRFSFVKVKVGEENAVGLVRAISKITSRPLRIDANEGFTSAENFLSFAKDVENCNIQFVEQPFPAADVESYKKIRGQCSFEIMADESIEDHADFSQLAQLFDSVNIKLMKTGGYHKALELIAQAKKHGMKVMLGCMIESSLGIACAMRLASLGDYFDLDGSLLIKDDPFGLIEEKEGRLTLLQK